MEDIGKQNGAFVSLIPMLYVPRKVDVISTNKSSVIISHERVIYNHSQKKKTITDYCHEYSVYGIWYKQLRDFSHEEGEAGSQ